MRLHETILFYVGTSAAAVCFFAQLSINDRLAKRQRFGWQTLILVVSFFVAFGTLLYFFQDIVNLFPAK